VKEIEFILESIKKGSNSSFSIHIDTGIPTPKVLECLKRLTEQGVIIREEGVMFDRYTLAKRK
jgi:DNA-binding Lrp family transcriptional regulator